MNNKERYRPVSLTRESQIITAICLLDLAVTLALLAHSPNVSEGNPLMSFYLQFGVGAFIMVKLCLLFAPIFIVEWCRQFRPRFARNMLRVAIVAYVGSYTVMFLQVNMPVLLADGLHGHQTTQVAVRITDVR